MFFFIWIGIAWQNGKVVEYEKRYDDVCRPKLQKDGERCLVEIAVTDKMKQPVFFYYKLENFWQNLRRYLMSKSIYQMQNHPSYTEKKAKEQCTPIIYLSDIDTVFNSTQKARMDLLV